MCSTLCASERASFSSEEVPVLFPHNIGALPVILE